MGPQHGLALASLPQPHSALSPEAARWAASPYFCFITSLTFSAGMVLSFYFSGTA
jgi:hypothetical protein